MLEYFIVHPTNNQPQTRTRHPAFPHAHHQILPHKASPLSESEIRNQKSEKSKSQNQESMVQPASPPPPNPQAIQQFLSTVLSQRGPSALPYSEDTKWLIRQHLVSLSASFPSLEPKTATFTHNDGRSVNLLQSDGTVPISFHGVSYNIPILLWLLDSYPRHPPCVYVNPTRDMIIKRPHPHVNPSGLVSVPYLHNWVYPSSNLVDLVKSLSLLFGQDPPLYSQRPRPSPSPSPSPSPNPSPTPTPSNPYPRPRPYPQGNSDAAEVYRRNAVSKLVEMVYGDVAGMRKAGEAEVEGMFAAQVELRRRGEEVGRGVREMADEKEALEQQLQMMLMDADVLEGWVAENRGRVAGKAEAEAEAEEAFECVDALSKQMMECTAGDLAVEDAVYALDKAVQEGAVPFDQYMRSVRLLSREQFFHRATAVKVRSVQMQAQVANMASRISQFVS